MRRTFIFIAALCVLLLFVLGRTLTLQAQDETPDDGSVEDIVITAVDETGFPTITATIRLLDSAGFPIDNISQTAIEVTEAGRPVTLINFSANDDGPVWGHLVVDAGAQLTRDRWAIMQDSISLFSEEAMKEGDRIAVTAIEGSRRDSIRPFTTSQEDIQTALDPGSYEPSFCRNPASSDCLTDSLTDLNKILDGFDDAQNQPSFIIFFTAGLETTIGGMSDLTDKANRLGIPIYTVLVQGQGEVEMARELGINSGGDSLTYTNDTDLSEFYQDILAKARPQYQLVYRSPNIKEGEPVELQVTEPDSGVTAQGSFIIDSIEPPFVTIEPIEALQLSPETTGQIIFAKAIFRDTHDRDLTEATLLLNGTEIQKIEATDETPINPTQIEFLLTGAGIPWEKMKNGEGELVVEVVDELNISSRSDKIPVTIMTQIDPGPTEEPETIPPTTLESTAVPDDSGESSAAPGFTNTNMLILFGMVLLIAGVVIVIAVKKKQEPGQSIRQTFVEQFDRITKIISRAGEAKAYLIVLEGDTSVGKHLEIYDTTTIGRAKQDSDLIFQQYDETSPISRRHCTIIDEEDHFAIRDEDSANGTYLNGVRLEPMVPRELYDGDEIELARVERGGVKFEFQLASPATRTPDTKIDDSNLTMLDLRAESFSQPRFTRTSSIIKMFDN